MKTSTETGYDFLNFYVDGERMGRWAGQTGWTCISFMVPEGSHHLTWSYEKDGGATGGQDCVWVDNIVLPPSEVVLDVDEDGPSTSSGTFAFVSDGNIIILDGPSTGSGACSTLQIVDVMGRVIRVCTDGVHTVSTAGMPAGMYVLRLINGNEVKVQKVIVE